MTDPTELTKIVRAFIGAGRPGYALIAVMTVTLCGAVGWLAVIYSYLF